MIAPQTRELLGHWKAVSKPDIPAHLAAGWQLSRRVHHSGAAWLWRPADEGRKDGKP